MEDAHSVANSLTWGPDGWLYGLQGSTVTARVRGIEFQQGVWRCHPKTRRFELFCEGGGNMWGLDFDRHGQLFASTNVGGFVMLHGLQGAYYWKSFGKHGPLHNPYTFGYFDHVHHEGIRGGHVAVGGLFYEADALPPIWRGRYIAADLLDHSIHAHEVAPRGSTYRGPSGRARAEGQRHLVPPTDLTLGPDGTLYVTDWHDRRTAHPDPDADWDRTNGRIFAIAARARPSAHGDPATLADVELGAGSITRTSGIGGGRRFVDRTSCRRSRRRPAPDRDRWSRIEGPRGALGPPRLRRARRAHGRAMLEHPDADVRAWCVRLLGDEPTVPGVSRSNWSGWPGASRT